MIDVGSRPALGLSQCSTVPAPARSNRARRRLRCPFTVRTNGYLFDLVRPGAVDALAKSGSEALAAELDRSRPDAAGSLREGLEDMFTVRRLGIDGTLARTLVCPNMIESMISIARTTTRNVKRWRDDGDMRRRWCAAGLLEAEHKFRRVRGHAQMPHLVTALRRHADTVTPPCDTGLAA